MHTKLLINVIIHTFVIPSNGQAAAAALLFNYVIENESLTHLAGC